MLNRKKVTMNKSNTKAINDFISKLEEMIDQAGTIKDSLDDSMQGKSEKFQESEKGEALSGEIENLDEAISALETAKEYLESARGDVA